MENDHCSPEHLLPPMGLEPPSYMDTAEYECGYVDGHAQAYADCLAWQPGAHLDGCPCQPCQVARHMLRVAGDAFRSRN
jgi:hypothetical protein